MSRQQKVTVRMAKQTSYQTQVRYLRKAAGGIHVSLYDVSKTPMGSSHHEGFEPDHDFGPRAVSDEKGNAVFTHLPHGVSCRLRARSADDGLQFWSEDRWTIDANPADIFLQKSKQPPFQAVFVDAQTSSPIGNVRVEGWYGSQQTIFSDQAGRVSTRAYIKQGRNCRIAAAPPDFWVREVFLIPAKHLNQELAVSLTAATIASGRVVDAVTGSGIAGVTLHAEKKNLQLNALTSSHDSIAETDRDGFFAIALAPGAQEILILPPVVGYQAPISRNKTQIPKFLRHQVSVNAGEPIENLVFKLAPAEPISGRVVNESGTGVAGAEVFCHLADFFGGFRDGLPLLATVTSAISDNQGRFSIASPAGETKQLKLKARFENRESPDVVVDIDPATGASGVELKLSGSTRKHEIVGRVLKDGQPWAGVHVKVEAFDLPPDYSGGLISRPWNVPPLGEGETDSDGRYRIEIDVSDVQRVSVSVARLGGSSPIVQLDRPTVDLGTIEYLQHNWGQETVRGTVVDPLGLPVNGVTVQASVRDRNYVGDKRPKIDARRSVTDEEGGFTIRDVFIEPVEITVRPADNAAYYQPSTSVTIEGGTQDAKIVFDRSLGKGPAQIDPVAVTDLNDDAASRPAQESGPNHPAHSIEGFVVDDKNEPIAGATVRVFCAQPINTFPRRNPFAHPACAIITTTDEQGIFAIGPIDADLKVRLVAGAGKYYATVGDFISPTADVEAAVIELGKPREETRGATIKQILKDKTGKPLPHAIVSLARIGDQDIQRFQSSGGPCVMTGTDGQLELVIPGNYFAGQVLVFPVGHPACILCNRITTPWPVKRKPGDYEYPAVETGFAITGRIVDEGQPVSGYVVCLRAGHAMPGTIRVATDEDGRFRIDGVASRIQYTLLGDIQQPKPKHLVSRRVVGDYTGKLVDFGDLSLEKMHELAVKVVPAPGAKIPPTMTVTCKLMSGGPSISANVSPFGDAVLEHVPGEPVEIWIGGRVAIEQTMPPLQRLYNPGQYGMIVSDDQVLIVQLK